MFHKSVIIAAVTILTFAGQTFCAPFDSCILLTPKNGQQPSQPAKTSPFKITAEKTMDSKDQHEAVRVTISSDKMEKFSGFIVQARYAKNPSLLVDGRFVPEDAQISKTYTCKPGEKIVNNNTWTNSENNEKETVSAIWVAPEEFKETIIFTATIMKDQKTFWEGVESDKIMIDMNVSVIGASRQLNWIQTPQVVAITNARSVSQGQNNKDGGSAMEGRSAAHKMDKISDEYKQDKQDKHDGGDGYSKGHSDGGYGDEKGMKGSASSLATSLFAMILSLALITLF